MHPLKILSIDFDYFANVDFDTVARYYPDGVDLTTHVSEIVWTSRYQKSNSEQYNCITKVENDTELLDVLEECLSNQSFNTSCSIYQSHKHIYDEIHKRLQPGQKVDIHHIDFHPDLWNHSDEVDCGNWLGYILKEIPGSKAIWYARQTGFNVFETPPEVLALVSDTIIDDLSGLLDHKFDFIFLCRSDAWTPPHLDEDFNHLVDLCSNLFDGHVRCESCVMESRNMKRILSIASVMDEQYKRLMGLE